MKLFDLTINKRGVHIRVEIEPMTAEQKSNIILSAIACAAFLGFFYILFG